jgi:UPF0716 protein FxsA
MQLGLFLIFIAVPLIEIAILIKVGQWIGFWWTFLIVILTAIAGTYVIHTQGLQVMRRAMDSVSKGQAPIAPIVDGSFLMIAGALLLAPGLLTDLAGLLLLIPIIRDRVSRWSLKKLLTVGKFNHQTFDANPHNAKHPPKSPDANASGQHPEGPIIEGEFERIDERTVDPKRQNPLR